MNIEWLREFCLAVEMSNITKAAEYSYTSQSSLSRHIAEIEKEIGTNLINRDNRKFELTPAGEYFYRVVSNQLSEWEKMKGVVAEIGKGIFSYLTFNSFTSYIPFIFDKLRLFKGVCPGVKYIHNVSETIPFSGLAEKEPDFCFAYAYQIPNDTSIKSKIIGSDDLCLVVPSSHRLATRGSAMLSDLHDENILLLSTTRYPVISDVIRLIVINSEQNSYNNQFHEIGNLDTLLLNVALGNGIAVLPRLIAQEKSGGCSLIRISDYQERLDIRMCWSAKNDNPALKEFLEFLENEDMNKNTI